MPEKLNYGQLAEIISKVATTDSSPGELMRFLKLNYAGMYDAKLALTAIQDVQEQQI